MQPFVRVKGQANNLGGRTIRILGKSGDSPFNILIEYDVLIVVHEVPLEGIYPA
jgi:hypothetical protein